jgi:hypothetical protein
MTVHVSMQQARDLAAMAVEERGPDYIYDTNEFGCVYFAAPNEPSCMVGYILHRLGIDSEELYESCVNNDAGVVTLVNTDIISCDLGVQEYLTTLQTKQDVGECWANAYLEAENELGFPAAVEMIEAKPIKVEVLDEA